MRLPASLPLQLGEVFEFNYGHTAGTSIIPAEARASHIYAENRQPLIAAETRTHSINADRRTA